MEKRSKTNKEIYEQEYPLEKLVKNPLNCAEAFGYLKALTQYLPSEEKWVDDELPVLLSILLLFTKY